jgi:hypothetical protein
MSAKSNIEKCPETCLSIDNVTGDIICIKAGEEGYHSVDQEYAIGKAMSLGVVPKQYGRTPENYREMVKQQLKIADILNREIYGVTPNQRAAMEMGSMFGWESPGADPDVYNMDGSLKK